MTNDDDMLTMTNEEFAGLVDKEVRGNAPPDVADALRRPEVADRWYHQLVLMKKNVESTLAAKTSEDKAQRLALLHAASQAESPEQAADLRLRSEQVRESYLKWRAGAIRFRAGVEERLAEAAWRRRAVGSYVPTALLDERNQLLRQVGTLVAAIRAHQSAMADYDPEDIDPADEELWKVLDGMKP